MSMYAWLTKGAEELIKMAQEADLFPKGLCVSKEHRSERPIVNLYSFDPTDPACVAPHFPEGSVEFFTWQDKIEGGYVSQGVYQLGAARARVIYASERVYDEGNSSIEHFQTISARAATIEELGELITLVRQQKIMPTELWEGHRSSPVAAAQPADEATATYAEKTLAMAEADRLL